MFGPLRVQLDLPRIACRLSEDGAKVISNEELERWLNARGFSKEPEGWRVEWVRNLMALVPGEITDVRTLKGRPVFRRGPASFVPAARALQKEFERIELRNAEMAKAASLPEIEECLVPERLIGLSPKAVSSWRTITRRAARVGNWDQALRDVKMVPIDHAPGDLLFHAFAGPHDWPNVALHAVHDHFATDTRREDSAEWGALERQLLLDGIGRFWFCLASLDGSWPLIIQQAPHELQKGMSRTILQAMMRWWPQFIRLSPRFLTIGDHQFGWPRWGSMAMEMCIELGAEEKQLIEVMGRGPEKFSRFVSRDLLNF